MDDPCVTFFFFFFFLNFFLESLKFFFFFFFFFFWEANFFLFFFFWEQLKFGVAEVKINETVLQQTRKSISISPKNILPRKTNSYLWQEVGRKFRPYSKITGVCLRCSRSNGNTVMESTSPSPNLPNDISVSFSSCLLHIYIYIYNIGNSLVLVFNNELIFVAVNIVPNTQFVRVTIISVKVCVSFTIKAYKLKK